MLYETLRMCLVSRGIQGLRSRILDIHQWIGVRENFNRKAPWSSWENLWFPVDFPLNQSIESNIIIQAAIFVQFVRDLSLRTGLFLSRNPEVVATLMGIPGWHAPGIESGTAWDSLRCDQTWLAREIPKVNGHLNWNMINLTYQWEIFHYPITRKHDDKHRADYQNNDIHPHFQWIDKFLLSRL